MHRRDLNLAEYNPRFIDEAAKKKLRKILAKHKLVSTLTFNKRSVEKGWPPGSKGALVGGHQRTGQLDALFAGNWRSKVSVIDVDEKTEKEINLALNNYEAQGGWDIEKLSEVLKDETIELEGAGFDEADVFRLIGRDPSKAPARVNEVIANANRLTEKRRERVMAGIEEKDNDDYYFVAVFKSRTERDAALDAAGLPHNKFQNGRTILKRDG